MQVKKLRSGEYKTPYSPRKALSVNIHTPHESINQIVSIESHYNYGNEDEDENTIITSQDVTHIISLVGALSSPYIDMKINKTPIKGLIDTGATRSCITSAAVIKYLGKSKIKQVTPTADLKLKAANGAHLVVLGELDVQLQMGTIKIPHSLVVFENEKCEFLVGNDILIDKFTVVKSRYLLPTNKPHEKIPIHYLNKSIAAYCLQNEDIPPMTSMEINIISAPDQVKNSIGCDVEVEATTNSKKGLILEPIVATPDTNGYVRCIISNNTNEYIKVDEGEEIACLNFIHDDYDEVSSINSVTVAPHAEISHDANAEQELLEGNKEGTLPDPPGYDGVSFETYDPLKVAKLDHLDKKQRMLVLDLIKRRYNAFAKSDADIGTTDLITHKIDVSGVTPLADPYRPVPVKYEADVEKKIKELLHLGVITEAKQSPWASNLVIVKKKETGKLRICCDLRGPNSVSKHKNKWPIRAIESSFAKLANAKFVTALDLLSAYWTIKMDDESSKVTAFYGPNAKHYQWLRMPFGLAAAPHTYCQLMSKVVQGLDEYCFFYFDDIIVYSQTFEEHLIHLENVIKRFEQAGFKINAKKCNFLCTESMPIEWLGSVIKHGKVLTDPKKVEAIKNITPPKSVKELQAFIGAVGFHRRHIPRLSDVINPLIELTKTKKNEPFIWTDTHQHSFEATKNALCSTEGLALPDINRPFILTSDSSHIAIGVCLTQIDKEGKERVCAYGSRKFKEIEQRNMSIPEKELAGILYGVKLFAYYLTNNKFTIKTDARSLVFLKRFKTCNSKIARAAIWLQEFDFDIVHLSRKHGNTMAIADCLSRAHESQFKLEGYKALKNPQLNNWPDISVPEYCNYEDFDPIADQFLEKYPIVNENINWISEEPEYPPIDRLPMLEPPELLDPLASYEHRVLHVSLIDACMTPKDFALIQLEDPEIVKQRKLATESENSDYVIIKDVLMKKNGEEFRVVVPSSFRNELIKWHHGSFWANHIGSKKLYASLARYYYWPNMFNTIKDVVRACKICQYVKPDTTGGVGLGKTKTPTRPNQVVAFDVVTGLPRTTAGHKCILVIVDDFTKFCTAVEMIDKTAESVARAFMKHWIRFFGPPKQLHSDEGTEVDSSLMQDICTILDIRKTHTPIYNPKSDGSVERLNQALGNMIQAYVTEYNKHKWHLLLPFMVSGYNNVVHTATGYTPAELLFGHDTANNMVPIVNIEHDLCSKSDYLQNLRLGQEIKWKIVNRRLEHLKDLRIKNSPSRNHSLRIGDFVLLKDLTPKVAKSAEDRGTKYHRRWKGPYRIIKEYPQALLIVHWESDLPKGDKLNFSHQGEVTRRNVILVHPNQVKPFIGNVEREPIINDDIIDKFLYDLGLKPLREKIVDRTTKTKYNLRSAGQSESLNYIRQQIRKKQKKEYYEKKYYFHGEVHSSDDDDDDIIPEGAISKRSKYSWNLTTPEIPSAKTLRDIKKSVGPCSYEVGDKRDKNNKKQIPPSWLKDVVASTPLAPINTNQRLFKNKQGDTTEQSRGRLLRNLDLWDDPSSCLDFKVDSKLLKSDESGVLNKSRNVQDEIMGGHLIDLRQETIDDDHKHQLDQSESNKDPEAITHDEDENIEPSQIPTAATSLGFDEEHQYASTDDEEQKDEINFENAPAPLMSPQAAAAAAAPPPDTYKLSYANKSEREIGSNKGYDLGDENLREQEQRMLTRDNVKDYTRVTALSNKRPPPPVVHTPRKMQPTAVPLSGPSLKGGQLIIPVTPTSSPLRPPPPVAKEAQNLYNTPVRNARPRPPTSFTVDPFAKGGTVGHSPNIAIPPRPRVQHSPIQTKSLDKISSISDRRNVRESTRDQTFESNLNYRSSTQGSKNVTTRQK